MATVHARASGYIRFGDRVLVRSGRAEVAGPDLANGTARSRPCWVGPPRYSDGDTLLVVMDDGLGDRDLHAIANGPIMDPSALYLPAGKISLAEAKARVASQILGDKP